MRCARLEALARLGRLTWSGCWTRRLMCTSRGRRDRPDRPAGGAARARGRLRAVINVEGNFAARTSTTPPRAHRGIHVLCSSPRSRGRSPRRRSAWRSTSRAGSAPPTGRCAPARVVGARRQRRRLPALRRAGRHRRLRRSRRALRAVRCRSAAGSACTTRGCRAVDPRADAEPSGLDELLAARASSSCSRPRRARTRASSGARAAADPRRRPAADEPRRRRRLRRARPRRRRGADPRRGGRVPEEPLPPATPRARARRDAALPAPRRRACRRRSSRSGGSPSPTSKLILRGPPAGRLQARRAGDRRPDALAPGRALADIRFGR